MSTADQTVNPPALKEVMTDEDWDAVAQYLAQPGVVVPSAASPTHADEIGLLISWPVWGCTTDRSALDG